MGRQMFAVGGYYAECRNVNGEWMIVRHKDIGDEACGDAQENNFAPEDKPHANGVCVYILPCFVPLDARKGATCL